MKTEPLTLTWHVDDGHEWLHATAPQLESLGLTQRDFSRYSYAHPSNGSVYAEGDCDAGVLFKSAARHGAEIVISKVEKRHSGNAPCRRMPRCNDKQETQP